MKDAKAIYDENGGYDMNSRRWVQGQDSNWYLVDESDRDFNSGLQDIMGYRVEKVRDDKEPLKVAYHLIGTRGAVYSLIRNQHHPEDMYIINSLMNVTSLKGNSLFTDKDGALVPVAYVY